MIILKNKTFTKYIRFVIGAFLPITLLILWQILYDNNLLLRSQSSSPKIIIKTFYSLTVESDFISNLFLSVFRLFIGVFIGSVLGVCIGIIASTNNKFNIFFAPTIQFFSGVPVIVWIPFWIMVFGIEESFKIGLISISTFFLVYGGIYQSILSIDKEYLDLGRLYQKKYSDMIKQVYIPYSLYSIFGAIRLSLIIGWIVLFFVENSISYEGKEGIGFFIGNARSVGKIDEEFLGLMILGLVAFVFDTLIAFFQTKSIEWKM